MLARKITIVDWVVVLFVLGLTAMTYGMAVEMLNQVVYGLKHFF